MKSILSLFIDRKRHLKDPEEQLQYCIRELNEKIPQLNSGIVELKEEISRQESELNMLISKEQKLIRKLKTVNNNSSSSTAEIIGSDLNVIQLTIDNVSSELEDMKSTYLKAIDSLKGFLFSKKNEMDDALSHLKAQSRQDWHDKCDIILKKCQHLWRIDDQNVKDVRPEKGTYRELLHERITDGLGKIKIISEKALSIHNDSIKNKIDEIIKTSHRMLDYLQNNPEEITNARMFLLYYLDAVIEIIEGYVKLSKQELETEKITSSLKKAELLIDEIRNTFIKLHEKLLEYEVLHFDAEMKVLKKTLHLQ